MSRRLRIAERSAVALDLRDRDLMSAKKDFRLLLIFSASLVLARTNFRNGVATCFGDSTFDSRGGTNPPAVPSGVAWAPDGGASSGHGLPPSKNCVIYRVE